MRIRKYEKKDFDKVRNICLTNADISQDNKKVSDFILLMFCDYYIKEEPECCFVAVDDEDNPVGYVYGAFDYDKYHKIFMEYYYPKIKSISLKRAISAKIEMKDHAVYKKEYPAHFHIDVLASNQSGGLGSKLLSKFCEHLEEQGSKGVMMICGKDNTGAQRFYKKNGFDTLHTKRTGVAMGKKFNTK
ncbi:MAG TPA: GNAT family N-acetyltransferase [Oscillospiraceae bacterium]|nr:GNAT family N-acetyltransferase [Oscillospiraceae bacterium]